MAWNDSVVTNSGISLLKEVLTGAEFTATSAAAGSGVVAAISLVSQTDLLERKQDISIVGLSEVENGKKFRLQITNKSLLTAYTMNQLGIWAAVDSGTPVLFAILQDENGILIPSKDDVPDFLLEFNAVVGFSSDGNFNVTVDSSAHATISDILELRDELDAVESSATTAAGAAHAQANNAYGRANAAYNQANTATTAAGAAHTQANAANNAANTATTAAGTAHTQANNAYARANSAYGQANAAYNQANAATTAAGSALTQANNAYTQANNAFNKANTATTAAGAAHTQANAAYNQANTATTAAGTAHTQANNAYTQANAAYNQANTATTAATTANTRANNAYNQANSAYGQANTATTAAGNAYTQANNAYARANLAYNQANAAYNQANTANSGLSGKAPTNHATTATTYGIADGTTYGHVRYPSAGTTGNIATAALPYTYYGAGMTVDLNAYRTAGTYTFYNATTVTNYPSGWTSGNANAGILEVLPYYSDTMVRQMLHKRGTNQIWVRYSTSATAWGAWEEIAYSGSVSTAYARANAAYNQANTATTAATTANTRANNAYNQANSAYTQANTANTAAGSAYTQANNAYARANTAYNQANAAYNAANNAVSVNMNPVRLGSGSVASINNSTAVGVNAKASGNYSTAVGAYTYASASATALGYSANASGGVSTALGTQATASGSQSTALGYCTTASGANSTALGYWATTASTEANYIQLGNASTLSVLRCRVALTVSSDERDKTDIQDIRYSLDFINRIRTIQYVNNHRLNYIDDDTLSDEEREKKAKYGMCEYDREAHAAGTKKGARKRVGVSAQQVQELLRDMYGSDNYADIVTDNLYEAKDVPEGVESQLTVNYTAFIPFLIQAVQELSERVIILEDKANV